MAVSKRFSLTYLITGLFLLITVSACNTSPQVHWSEFIPETVPFIIVPEQGTTIPEMLDEPYIPLFDDVSPSAIHLISSLEEEASPIEVEAMLLYTDTSNDWQPVWITKVVSGLLGHLSAEYSKPFEQNEYLFQGHRIQKLYISDRIYFVAEVSGWMIFSESSLGIEHLLRTVSGHNEALSLDDNHLQPGSVIVNTEKLDRWVQQIAQVSYRPALAGTFKGAKPAVLQLNPQPEEQQSWQLTGEMEVADDASPFIRSISSAPAEFTLDRYIPLNTSAFSIQKLEPRMVPPDHFVAVNETDEYIDQNLSVWRDIAEQLEDEFAFAAFAESGASSSSEYLYLRKIRSGSEIRSALNILVGQGLATRTGNSYSIQSRWLAKLFGSEINPMTDFYITLYNEVAAFAERRGLAESIGSEASRRRVMFYDDDYMDTRDVLPSPLSSILYVKSAQFSTYIQPWLDPQNYFNQIISTLNHFVLTTQAQPGQSLQITATSFLRESEDQPYREQWVFPLNGANITGNPVLVDIGGSNRDEVVFSTERGSVYALATDGTVVLETSTGSDTPVGTPVVYDWYGNNQNVIMQAAGNKIYAWDSNGSVLPNFPVRMQEEITTPLIVRDVTRNGVAEMIVATADRNVHILDARGQALNGWPQSANSVIESSPLITDMYGQRAIFAFAENALHGWNINGTRRSGFPVFLNSQMYGTPSAFNNYLLGAGRDGHLYAVGNSELFTDSLSTSHRSDSLRVSSVAVTNSPLNATPSVHDLLLRSENEFYREHLILTQSRDGSVFLYNENGELRFTRSLGQPASGRFQPLITDLDNNQRQNVVALADFGRLYAWDVISQQRLFDLPTTGMNHIVIGDLLGNGNNELIAHTRDGIRCWTILQTRMGE